jgi:sulfite oxidase
MHEPRVGQRNPLQHRQVHVNATTKIQWRAQTCHKLLSGAAVIGLTIVAYSTLYQREASAESKPPPRLIRLHEIHKHNRASDSYWVYRGDKVYDITDWVPNHPGGEVILKAVGGNIEPYWKIFTIHQNQDVYDILDQYLIGKVDPRDLVDGKAPASHVDDPFESDPERADTLIVRSSRPCNAETPKDQLEKFITPSDQHYVRNHLWVPKVDDGDGHRLLVELIDGQEKEYTVAELRSNFRHHTITATLQCSGNRRAHMTAEARQTSGLQWDVGAISTAEWTGVKLRDVLQDAGMPVDELPERAKHVQFVGAEAYGASVPAIKAVDRYGDVLLVFEMNGEPLLRDHGFPLRLLCPGHVAARSVKWLKKIVVSDEESHSQWQRRDYKCFGPNQGSQVDWDKAVSIQETPIQSAITSVTNISKDRLADTRLASVYGLEEDCVTVTGYAYSGGGRDIVRVDVSSDDGKTWRQAELLDNEAKGSKTWCWKRWQIAFEKHNVVKSFVVKAIDESYNCQPESYAATYNFKGNLTTGWHRVPAVNKPVA